MVKIGSPLMSISASGKIGERLVFSNRSSGQQVRFQKSQKDFMTASRSSSRRLYDIAVVFWSCLSESEKLVYDNLAKDLRMTGYNYFIKCALLDPALYLSLKAFWTFDKIYPGNIVKDIVGGYDGVLNSTAPVNLPVLVDFPLGSAFVPRFQKALKTNSTNGYVLLPNTRDLDPADHSYTFSCFIFCSPYSSVFSNIFSAGAGTSGPFTGNGVGFQVDRNSNSFRVVVRGSSGGIQAFLVSYSSFLNKFIRITFTLNPLNFKVRFYINGDFISETTFNNWGSINSDSALMFFKRSITTVGVLSTIDDVQIYHRLLSDQEIKKHYQRDMVASRSR